MKVIIIKKRNIQIAINKITKKCKTFDIDESLTYKNMDNDNSPFSITEYKRKYKKRKYFRIYEPVRNLY